MNGSNASEHFNAKHERNHEQRIESIKRWVEYIKSEPPETWGPNRTQSSTTNSMRPRAYRSRRLISNT
jgi:hypothetical protein